MTCQEQRGSLIELARGRLFDVQERTRAAAHWSACPDCRHFMEEQIALTSAAAALAEEASVPGVPAHLERILLREFLAARTHRKPIMKRVLAVGAIAAMIAFAWVLGSTRASRPPVRPAPVTQFQRDRAIPETALPPEPQKRAPRRAPRRAETSAPRFIAIPYAAPLDPRERATIMRIEMPVAALTAVGLATSIPDTGATAETEAIVGEDGRIRGIRLLSITTSIPTRSNTQ